MASIVKRKWGFYITLISAARFKVKILRFYEGLSCSKQYHYYRNELWLVLRGMGKLNTKIVRKGDWRVIHKKRTHQFTALKPSWVLEIQYGDKCEEEDIVRL